MKTPGGRGGEEGGKLWPRKEEQKLGRNGVEHKLREEGSGMGMETEPGCQEPILSRCWHCGQVTEAATDSRVN